MDRGGADKGMQFGEAAARLGLKIDMKSLARSDGVRCLERIAASESLMCGWNGRMARSE
jgi:hypothetical protein